MNTLIAISSLELPRRKLEAVCSIYPQGRVDHCRFAARLPESDARMLQILGWLEREGYRPWDEQTDLDYSCEYNLARLREYDASDWEQAEYLEPHIDAIDEIYHVGRDEEGRLIVGGKDLVMEQDFEITIFNEWVAPQRTREILENANLEGLTFRPVVIDPKEGGNIGGKAFRHPAGDKPPRGGPWWEITSDIKLPPVAASMTLSDQKGNPLPPGDENVIYTAREGSYNHAELHFRRSDMEQMEPFDIALTREHFHVRPRIVVSSRFYRACAERSLRINWVPVHLD